MAFLKFTLLLSIIHFTELFNCKNKLKVVYLNEKLEILPMFTKVAEGVV